MKISFSISSPKGCSVYSTSRAISTSSAVRESQPTRPTEAIDSGKTIDQSQSLLLAKLPLEIRQEIYQFAIDQSQSLLLAKLPLEIRRKIYRIALGHKTIHFIRHDVSSRIRCPCPLRECDSPKLCSYGDNSQCHSCTVESALFPNRKLPTWKKSNLLVVCRRVYDEAVDILASDNTVNLIAQDRDDLLILSDMQAMMLSSQYQAIRSIEFCYHIANNRKAFDDFQNPLWFTRWAEMCACLEGLRGLRDLHMWINNEYSYNRRREMTPEQEQQIFEPLVKVTRPTNFEVEISWPATTAAADISANASFKLTRRVGFVCPCEVVEAKDNIIRSSSGKCAENGKITEERNPTDDDSRDELQKKEGVGERPKPRKSRIWRRPFCC